MMRGFLFEKKDGWYIIDAIIYLLSGLTKQPKMQFSEILEG